MSQHNIVGSEAFSSKPYVLVRNVRPGGFRRRRSRAVTAYVVVAVLALSAGAAVAAFAMGPFLVQDSAAVQPTLDGASQPAASGGLTPSIPASPAA